MRHASRHTGNSLTIALFFVCCIVLLIVGGLFLKLFLVLRASSFDGMHQYIVEIDESHQKGMLVSFDPAAKSLTLLTVHGRVDTAFGRYLGVPTDAVIAMPIPTSPTKIPTDMIFKGRNEKGITFIDKIRLLLFVNSLKHDSIHTESITLPVNADADKLLQSLFLDNTLYFDNESVSVVNATGEEGIASDIAHQLTLVGMNVVSATTALNETESTQLTAINTNTYTVHRIERLFRVTAQHVATQGISDITLTIGKKSLSEIE